jgi:hypothetical protein
MAPVLVSVVFFSDWVSHFGRNHPNFFRLQLAVEEAAVPEEAAVAAAVPKEAAEEAAVAAVEEAAV